MPPSLFKNEKQIMLVDDDPCEVEPLPTTRKLVLRLRRGIFVAALCFSLAGLYFHHVGRTLVTSKSMEPKKLCPQSPLVQPVKHAGLFQALEARFATKEFREAAYESLGGAVRIPTETYDDVGPVGEDSHWEKFGPFHKYLEDTFPLAHAHLRVTKVNTWALVFHWQGSDHQRSPILLTAHQDVVPVHPDTVDSWIQPPFSGYYDGEWIWGRGSGDDKSGLISLMVSVETLLSQDFKPSRTVVLAFGMDEERGGKDGASALGRYLLDTYGENSFALLLDEGSGYKESNGAIFARPSVAEKGKLDVRIEVSTPGGHSSVPPPHTGIGILSSAIALLEDNPLPVHLDRKSVHYEELLCSALHSPSIDPHLKKLILSSTYDPLALQELEDLYKDDPLFKAQVGTTQAADLVGGGIKSNALPEQAWAVVNHRISELSSVGELEDRWATLLTKIADRFNVSLAAFDKVVRKGAEGHGTIRLSDAYGTALEPAPVTPTFGDSVWEILSGTIRSSILSNPRNKELPVFVIPGLGLGNTDTRHYWKLTKSIFRYAHSGAEDSYNGAHTINEAIRAEGFLEIIRFHIRLILNLDEANSL